MPITMTKLIHGLPARCWKKKPLPKERASPPSKMEDDVREHRHAKIRYLADQLADEFSDVGRSVSARQVLDALERFWPHECRFQLAKGQA